jgi:hypothetical protein
MPKVTLRFPTLDAPAGSDIDVDKDTADYLVANGSAVPAAKPAKG